MFRAVILALVAAAVLSACTHIPTRYQLSLCGDDDTRPWKRVKEPPANADELRRLAGPKRFKSAGEAWFVLPSGDVMLCRISASGVEIIEWWQFDLSGEEPRISYGLVTFVVRH